MQIEVFHFNPFMENTYVLYDSTGQGVIIDPGMSNVAEQNVVKGFINEKSLTITSILLTHAHIDHIFGLQWAQEYYNLPAWCHALEQLVLDSTPIITKAYGLPILEVPENVHFFEEKTTVSFGETTLKIRFTPGHSPGSVCFLEPKNKQLIVGDVLFKESIGRTDLPGGNYDTLLQSIRSQLLVLEDDWKVYPGHGPMTTIGFERTHNPFLVNL